MRFPSPQQLEKAAEILRAVAHPVRLRIIQLLEHGERTVTQIHTALELQQAYVSQQLAILKVNGVLAARRQGNQVFYRIHNRNVIQIIHCICFHENETSRDEAASARKRSQETREVRNTINEEDEA